MPVQSNKNNNKNNDNNKFKNVHLQTEIFLRRFYG